MSRQADEKKVRGGKSGSKTANGNGQLAYVSFHPSAAEKQAIREGAIPAEEILSRLSEHLSHGIAVKVSRTKLDNAFAATAMDASADYGEGQALGCFHADLETALMALVYCLEVKYPNWPVTPITAIQAEFDW